MEIDNVIRDLVNKGMSKEEIVNTLNQMGVNDSENLVSKALENTVQSEPQQPVTNTSGDFSELKSKLEILIDLNKQILESQRQILFKLK